MAQMKIGSTIKYFGHSIKRVSGTTFEVNNEPVHYKSVVEIRAAIDAGKIERKFPPKRPEPPTPGVKPVKPVTQPAAVKTEFTPRVPGAPRLCCCGCGAYVTSARKRVKFLQGHDARLKGILSRVAVGKEKHNAIPAVAIPFLRDFAFTPESLRK